jgi:hypothetical protein
VVAVVAAAALVGAGTREAPLTDFWRGGHVDRIVLLLELLPVFVLAALVLAGYVLWGRRHPVARGAEPAAPATGPSPRAPRLTGRLLRALPPASILLTAAILALLSTGDFRPPAPAFDHGVVEVPGVGILRTSWGMNDWFEMGVMAGEGGDEAHDPLASGSESEASGLSLRGRLLALVLAVGMVAVWAWYRRRQDVGGTSEDPDADESGRKAVEGALDGSIEAMLADPDPNTAIRGAYARLLSALDAQGRGRWDHEGPVEHLHRVLGTLRVRPAPLRELLELFELARFSPHILTTMHRDRALLALRQVAAELKGAS